MERVPSAPNNDIVPSPCYIDNAESTRSTHILDWRRVSVSMSMIGNEVDVKESQGRKCNLHTAPGRAEADCRRRRWASDVQD